MRNLLGVFQVRQFKLRGPLPKLWLLQKIIKQFVQISTTKYKIHENFLKIFFENPPEPGFVDGAKKVILIKTSAEQHYQALKKQSYC